MKISQAIFLFIAFCRLRLTFERFHDLVLQFAGVKGFCEVIGGPRAKSYRAAVAVIQRGDDDDGGLGEQGFVPQHPGQTETVRLGHHQVDQEQVGNVGFRQFDRLGTVIDCHCIEAIGFE